MIFQKSQPVETGHECSSFASTGPLKNMHTSSKARKSHAHETQRVAFLHARTPTHSPPDVKTGRRTPRSLYTLLHSRMFLFCLLRVWLFAMGRVITRLDLT